MQSVAAQVLLVLLSHILGNVHLAQGHAGNPFAAAVAHCGGLSKRALLDNEPTESPPPPPPPPPPPDSSSASPAPSSVPPAVPQAGSPPVAPPSGQAPPNSTATASPAASAAAAVSLSASAEEDVVALILQLHNEDRARHENTPPLSWSTGLQTSAQAWAQHCLFQHSGDSGVGENLYEAKNYPAYTAPGPEEGWRDAMRSWYNNEIVNYNWASPSFSEASGHFTQVVWAATQQVGCARVDGCYDSTPGQDGWARAMYVCQYSPPGNVQSQQAYQQNVLPLQPADSSAIDPMNG